jgi:hypothetical protein
LPRAFGINEVRWTTSYKARLLAAAEALTDARDDEAPFPSVAKGTRRQWLDQLEFRVDAAGEHHGHARLRVGAAGVQDS